MTVSEFKYIFFMEYAHRMWGRCIGGVFLFPAIYFWSRGHLSKTIKPRIIVYGILIGMQGLMGWYMVKSGLEQRFHEPNDIPRVSQYRLAAHLTFAFALYTAFLWSALDHIMPAQELKDAVTKGALRFRKLAHATKGMVFLTALTGNHFILLNIRFILILIKMLIGYGLFFLLYFLQCKTYSRNNDQLVDTLAINIFVTKKPP